jgi:predicted nucleic acid-binding protein
MTSGRQEALGGIETTCMRGEASRSFVDTNVLVYAYDVSAGRKHDLARDLITELWDSRTGCISVQVLQELFVVLTQKVGQPMDAEGAQAIVSDLSTWAVCAPDAADVLEAIALNRQASVSFWDAMIVSCAAKLGCDTLYSEDLSHEETYAGVRVVNPFL